MQPGGGCYALGELPGTAQQGAAPGRLAGIRRAQRHRLGQGLGQGPERFRLAGLELQLQLADRHPPAVGQDLPLVQGHLDASPGVLHSPGLPVEVGGEARREPREHLAAQLRRRQPRKPRQVQPRARYLPLPLAAAGESAAALAAGLDRLQGAPVDAAQAQRHAGGLEVAVGGVEVGVAEPLPDRRCCRQQRVSAQCVRAFRSQGELQLDLMTHDNGVSL